MHKVIFDTDPGIDDAMALLFLERHPDIELLGITSVFGNASADTTTRNAQFLKREFGIKAPVARGADVTFDPGRPMASWPTFVHGVNGLGDIDVPETIEDVPLDPRPAFQFIIDTVREHPGEVEIVAVGRMTNLAMALARDPEIAGLVKQVVVMGGAFDTNGNVTPAAEANIHGDPEAADVVFTAPWKVVIIGLDVTLQTVMTRTMMKDLALRGGPAVELLARISDPYIDFYSQQVEEGMVVHDSCACAYVVAPELFGLRSGSVRVVCGGVADGLTLQKPAGRAFGPSPWDDKTEQKVAMTIEAEKVVDLIAATLAP
ncbi:nucleoside hydrolase [Martelella mediterranea]|uniref:Pyrimidine-specific ribonucleoside hydrolase RihB n=1 Tax=Martelella mediterranea DSM 17316 TaxID=1122214 RepID=A0A1U9Z382_9HYPH|nr:nucleoside hydrolase [Martelella mediterranea]AQZ52124.1 Pyrimidine-specific ribonucleoside hydrolase RihB [Martelella mediterranea DSM 17316]